MTTFTSPNVDQYVWSCDTSGGGGFAFKSPDGYAANVGQMLGSSATWNTPNAPGVYTLSCDIPNTLNVVPPDSGSRAASTSQTVTVYVPDVEMTCPTNGSIMAADGVNQITVSARADLSCGSYTLNEPDNRYRRDVPSKSR